MNPPAIQETPVQFLGQEDPVEKGSTPVSLGFPGGSDGKKSACSVGDLGSVPGLEDPLEKGRLPTPVFWPGEFHGLYNPSVTKSQT